MKTKPHRITGMLCACAAALPLALTAASLPVESQDEFVAHGDFNNDGHLDVAVVSREMGAVRVGNGDVNGNFTWTGPFATGVRDADGLAVGRFVETNRSHLMLAGARANRVVLLRSVGDLSLYPTRPLVDLGRSPTAVAALEIGGANKKANFDDVFVLQAHNGFDITRADAVRNQAGQFNTLAASSEQGRTRRAGPIATNRTPATSLVGFLRETNFTWRFQLHDFANGLTFPGLEDASVTNGIVEHTLYTVGHFAGNLPHIVFYQPGQSLIRSVALLGGPGKWSFGPVKFINFPASVRQLIVAPGGNGPDRLVVTFSFGSVGVGIYSFDGDTFPTLIKQIDRPANANFTTAIGLPGEAGFLLLSGGFVADGSTGVQHHGFDGTLINQSALPPIPPLFDSANVLLFDSEPFVNDARLVRAYRAGDWTGDLDLHNPLGVIVRAETFGGSETGLNSPMSVNLGAKPAGAAHGLPNQVRPWMSVFSMATQAGAVADDVRVDPPPGTYREAVRLRFTALGNSSIRYRFGDTASWNGYDPANPPYLIQSTVVEYLASAADGTATRIHQANYTIGNGNGSIDSDGDGVPDFVEVANGLDPTSGPDHDGDGDTDLAELLTGTNPADPSSKGDRFIQVDDANDIIINRRTNVVDLQDAFDLLVTLRPINGDGVRPDPTTITAGTEVSGWLPSGGLLSVGSTREVPGGGGWNARLAGLPLEPGLKFVSVRTPPVIPVGPSANPVPVGRELLSLIPIPAPVRVEVPENFSGDAQQWINDARQAYAAARLRRVEVAADVGVPETVAALALERLIGIWLSLQGEITNSSVTLFPDRAADANRIRISSRLLDRFERPTNHLEPGFLLSSALSNVVQQLANPANEVADLLTLADLIYTIHSREVDAANGTNSLGSLAGNAEAINDFLAGHELTGAAARSYVSPVDTLRQFIGSGTVPPVYLEDPAVTPALLMAASNGVNQVYGAVHARPFVQLTLQSSFGSLGGDYVELQDGQFNSYILLNAGGRPFRLPPILNLSSATFSVRGYLDVNPPDGIFGNAIEVISVELTGLPPTTGEDNDGNLLADNWERLFYGDIGNNPFGIPGDGSGWTILQRYLAGEDPSAPVGPALNLAPPYLSLTPNGNDTVTLTWDWPFEFANDVTFSLRDADSVVNGFNQRVEGPASVDQDHFGVTVPTDSASHRFYDLTMQLNVPFLYP